MFQRLTFQKFHGDEAPAFTVANFVNGADVRVVQNGSGTLVAIDYTDPPKVTSSGFDLLFYLGSGPAGTMWITAM